MVNNADQEEFADAEPYIGAVRCAYLPIVNSCDDHHAKKALNIDNNTGNELIAIKDHGEERERPEHNPDDWIDVTDKVWPEDEYEWPEEEEEEPEEEEEEPEVEEPEEPVEEPKTKSLAIVTDIPLWYNPFDSNQFRWLALAADFGEDVGCRDNAVWDEWVEIDLSRTEEYYPGGEHKMYLWGEECVYKNNGYTEGSVWCPPKGGEEEWREYKCQHDPRDKDEDKGRYECEKNWTREPVFICEW